MSKDNRLYREARSLAGGEEAQILASWRQLPPEMQVAVVLEQVRALLDSECEPAVRQALAPEGEGDARQHTCFPVTSISREDLQRLDFGQEEIDRLTDKDMAWIARKVEDRYVESGSGRFWPSMPNKP